MRLAFTATLVTAGAALLGAAAAFAAVAPTTGTIGTSIVIDTPDNGTKPPKAFLFDTATSKKIPMKVTAFTQTQVTAEVLGGYAGTFDVRVDTKDGMDHTEPQAFTIAFPAPEFLNPATANPEATVTIQGQYFGTKKPKVYAGGKKAKVVTFTDGTCAFLVPKTLPNGAHDVLLRNKIGFDTLGAALTVQNSTVGIKPIKGKEFISGKFGANNFKTGGPGLNETAVTYAFQDLGDINIVVGTSIAIKGTSVTNTTVSFSFAQDIAGGALPATVNASVATYNRSAGLAVTAYTSTGPGGTFSVTVDKFVGGRAQGSFTGTLNKGAGDGPAQIVVSGKFLADVLQ